ncbi:MAG: cytochrome-c peroxidase, partial [Desulfuromonadales bacterium]|nr:cytochrome-c peroxidase [Desulfuromonadales bacterium]
MYLNKILIAGFLTVALGGMVAAAELSPVENLGKQLFFDASLSNPPGQSCADCHDPTTGWTGPDSAINAAGAVEPGTIHTRFGNRKPPTSAYAGFTPLLHQTMGGGG